MEFPTLYLIEFICMALILFVIRIHTSQNAVAAALYLVGAFFLSAILVLVLKADFIASLFIIVYVGAIAVLFLFVIMMLRTKEEFAFSETEAQRQFNMLFLASFLPLVLFAYLYMNNKCDGFCLPIEHLNATDVIIGAVKGFAKTDFAKTIYANLDAVSLFLEENDYFSLYDQIEFIVNFGQFLYNYYVDVVILAGILLLVALMGTIMITHHYDRSEIRESEHLLSRTDKFISFIDVIK